MFINLGEEIIPTSDQSALVLVSNQFEITFGPSLLDSSEELFKNQFSTSLSHDCIHFDSVFDEIGLPKIVKSKILKLDLDVQFREEHSPVTGFHGIALEFLEDIVDFFVFLDKCFVLIVDIMRSESIWELVHLFQKTVQLILYLFVNVGRKWDLVDVFNWFPNLIYCGPNAFE